MKCYATPGRKCATSSVSKPPSLVCYHRRRISGVLAPLNCLGLISYYYQFACAPPSIKLDGCLYKVIRTQRNQARAPHCPLFSLDITWTIDKIRICKTLIYHCPLSSRDFNDCLFTYIVMVPWRCTVIAFDWFFSCIFHKALFVRSFIPSMSCVYLFIFVFITVSFNVLLSRTR